ncbi:hypothetical protein BCU68_05065 [Vibrio sp. 10N.286.49.B3]|uniref:DUF2919 domain-containing protein n=1 Tax=Vibrio sp. 10N.286.49.B3 TaxID=1880855 RepID=UPI000C851F45|nr:DUF2919 domain-containing protein [Vibrio sp. 10N.286.49.B3]PMH41054.1 hypothetical protein BCU68_05065 [Vibrio sp. 10N.286.49.B3]
MRYSFEQYNQDGFLKIPYLIWAGWLLLAKAWVVFIVAGASRDSGTQILSIVYPDHKMLYLGLIIGTPSLLLMWISGLRNPDRKWINQICSWARGITLSLIALEVMQTCYFIYLDNGAFRWSNALSLVLMLWFILYLTNSRLAQDCFKIPVEVSAKS